MSAFALQSLMRSRSASEEKSAEHDRVRRAQTRAREHRDGRFRNHAHVNRDAIAFGDAEVCERGGEPDDLAMKLEVRERAHVAGLALEHDRRARSNVGRQMSIEAALGEIQFRADEKLRVRQLPLGKFLERLAPHEIFRLLGPKRFGLFDRLLVERRVFVFRLHARVRAELRARRKLSFFFEVRNDGVRHDFVRNPRERADLCQATAAKSGYASSMAFLRHLPMVCGFVMTACSLLVTSSGVQCTVDSDCAARGFDAGGAAIHCVSSVCVGPGGSCAQNSDCASGNAPTICRKDTLTCASLLSPDCATVYGNYQDDDAIVLGSILSLKGTNASSGTAELQSAELALDDFTNTVVGLPRFQRWQTASARARAMRRLGRRHDRATLRDAPREGRRGASHSRAGLERAVHDGDQQRDHPRKSFAHQPRRNERDTHGDLPVFLAHVAFGRHPSGAAPFVGRRNRDGRRDFHDQIGCTLQE